MNIEEDMKQLKATISDMTDSMKINFLLNKVTDMLIGRDNLENIYYQTKAHLEEIICESEGIDPLKWEEIKSIYKAKNFILLNEKLGVNNDNRLD